MSTRLKSLFLATGLVLALGACEPAAEEPGMEAEGAAAPSADTDAAGETAPADAPRDALVDPNDAGREDLLALPHMNEALADALMAGRPYDDMVAVDQVLATELSEEQREEVYGRLWRPIDLNTASGEEILLIPGVGERMRHEFEEYRPYRAIAEFRREIGKYVDDEEVARLERYVTIRS